MIFISGPSSSLPPVDVLLLSQITLGQCNIYLYHCPISLILSTSRLRIPLGWGRQFWRISHANVGGCIDGHLVLYSASRLGLAVALPPHSSTDFLTRDNERRVMCSTISNRQHISNPLAGSSSLVDTLFSLGITGLFFIVPSVYSPPGWCHRRLS